MTDSSASRPGRYLLALTSAAAVLYGVLVWCGFLPNLPNWHYYPKLCMLLGCIGLWSAVRYGRRGEDASAV